MDFVTKHEAVQGKNVKFFIKVTIAKITAYSQCGTTYWTPDCMDFSTPIFYNSGAQNGLFIQATIFGAH